LRTFVRALILNTATYQEAVRKQRKAQVLAQNRIPLQDTSLPTQSIAPALPNISEKPTLSTGYTSINATYTPHTQQSSASKPLLPPPHRPLPLRQPFVPRPSLPQKTYSVPPVITFSNPSLQQWLQDQSIQSIECPGPGKPVVIVKQNRPQITNTSFDAEAIQTFLQEVAEKTKIPIGEGLYKAIIGPYIITAVLSTIIGNRYIIQRR